MQRTGDLAAAESILGTPTASHFSNSQSRRQSEHLLAGFGAVPHPRGSVYNPIITYERGSW